MFFDTLVSGGCRLLHVLQIAAVFSCRVPTFSHSVPQPIYKHSRKWKKILNSLAATRIPLFAKTETGTTERNSQNQIRWRWKRPYPVLTVLAPFPSIHTPMSCPSITCAWGDLLQLPNLSDFSVAGSWTNLIVFRSGQIWFNQTWPNFGKVLNQGDVVLPNAKTPNLSPSSSFLLLGDILCSSLDVQLEIRSRLAAL